MENSTTLALSKPYLWQSVKNRTKSKATTWLTLPLAMLALGAALLSCSANSELPTDDKKSAIAPKPAQVSDTLAATKVSVKKANCNKTAFDKVTLPSMVLAGTEVFEKSQWQAAPLTLGSYTAEVGGAVIAIALSSPTQGIVNIERSYREPGMSPDNKKYDGLCVDGSRLYGTSVMLEFVNDGVLLWEGNSGNAFISSDLFMFLKEDQ